MTATRDVGDLSVYPGGKSGEDWTGDTRDSLLALWSNIAGLLQSVAGTNAITASLLLGTGFSALGNGMVAILEPANSNTGAVTLDINSTGAKSVRDNTGTVLSAGDLVAGSTYLIVFLASDDHWRILSSAGTTNVTLQGGKLLKRSAPQRLATAQGPATSLTAVASQSFSAGQSTSRVAVEGAVSVVMSSGAEDADGLTIRLYVDGADSGQSFTDHADPGARFVVPVYFEYSPGDTDSHDYELRAECTISTTYPKSSNFIVCSEVAPND